MYREFEVVKLRNALSERLPAGSVGTVLLVHDVPRLPVAYEVEFLDQAGDTIAVLTVKETDLVAAEAASS
jgi:hypothetical protein